MATTFLLVNRRSEVLLVATDDQRALVLREDVVGQAAKLGDSLLRKRIVRGFPPPSRGYMYATLNAPLLKPVQGVGEMNVAGVRISENEANFIPFGCEFDAS